MKADTKFAIAVGMLMAVLFGGGLYGAYWSTFGYWDRKAKEGSMDCDSTPTPVAGCLRNGVPTIVPKID